MADGKDTQSRIDAARSAGLSDVQILQQMKDSPKYKDSFAQARNAGLSDGDIAKDFGLNITASAQNQKDLGTQPTITFKSNNPDAQKLSEAKPNNLKSFALGAINDVGGGINQGVSYLEDLGSKGINALLGTNLKTNRYDEVTRDTNEVNQAYEQSRRSNGDNGVDVARIVGNVAASIPTGALAKGFQGAKVLSGAGAKVLGQNAALGGLIGGAQFADDSGQRISNIALGAIGGGAGAAAGEKIGQAATGFVRKITPSTASEANINIIINTALKNSTDDTISGLSVGDLSSTAQEGLRNEIKSVLKQGREVDAKTVERMAIFSELKGRGLDLKPTGKQATGNPKLWTKETELSKLDGGDTLNNRYIQQNQKLVDELDNLSTETGGKSIGALQTGESVIQALGKSDAVKQELIKNLYNAAKNHSGNELSIDAQSVVNNSKQAMVDNFINPDKAQSVLIAKLKPFLPKEDDPTFIPEPFTLKDKELFVKQINSTIGKTSDGETRQALGLVRSALENEVDNTLNQFGGTLNGEAKNAWDAARLAASQRFKDIERTPALKAAIADVAPDQFFNKFVLSKSSAVRDVKALTNELKDNPDAMNNLRLEIMRFISDNAVTNQGQAVSPAGMNRALKAIGDDKLKLFFSSEEIRHLKNINAASRYLYSQPMGSNVNNSNTSSALLNMLGYMDLLKKIPIIGPKVDNISKSAVNSVNAQVKINQGNKAVSVTSTKGTDNITSNSTIERLRKAGLISGSNIGQE